MEKIIPRIMIAAPASGNGKTLITCILLQELVEREYKTAAFKCGPDYIDPMYHRQIIGNHSANLDGFFLDENRRNELLADTAADCDIAVVEGAMGYYDGMRPGSLKASSYEIALQTKTPVVLVVDCSGMSLSIVPYIQGFVQYQPSAVQGVLLNKIAPSIYPEIKQCIENQCHVPVFGYFPKLTQMPMESRHLGLVRPEEVNDWKEVLTALTRQMEQTVDFDGIIALAEQAPVMQYEPYITTIVKRQCRETRKIRLAVARDEAFGFYYEEELRLFCKLGAELIPFSPIHEKELPQNCCGILLGGGYPELYAKELSDNQDMKENLKKALNSGMPCIAECGGFLYLQKTLQDKMGRVYPMTGVLMGNAYPTPKMSRFGYIQMEGKVNSVLGKSGIQIPAHEFHYWESDHCGDSFLAVKPSGTRQWEACHCEGSLIAGFPHFYLYARPEAVLSFLNFCEEYAKGRVR